MTLEAAIQENTSALRELIAAIKSGVATTAAQVAAVVTEGKSEPCGERGGETAKEESKAKAKGEKETAAKKTPAAPAITSTPPTAQAHAAQEKQSDTCEASDKAAQVPTYQDTAAAITKLARAKGRDAAVAVLSNLGAAKLPDVKPAQYADVIAACNQALDG